MPTKKTSSTNCETLSSFPLESQSQAPDMASLHIRRFCSKRKEKRTFTSLAMFMGQLECKMRIYTGWKVYFNLWVCYIFFFHHTALQIILVLFLWCIKLAHSLPSLSSPFRFWHQSLRTILFHLYLLSEQCLYSKMPFSYQLLKWLDRSRKCEEERLPHATVCRIAFMFSPSLRGEMYNTHRENGVQDAIQQRRDFFLILARHLTCSYSLSILLICM